MTTRTKRLSEPAGTIRYAQRSSSPFGDLWAVVDEAGALVQLDFEHGRSAPRDDAELSQRWDERGHALRFDARALEHVGAQLTDYFEGRARTFDLEVAPSGTDFQRRVWAALLEIPCGATESYGELAARLERPGASRAVGRANGTNPVSLVIPCHRVIGADGSLTGYGGGMDRKRALLVHEGVACDPWSDGLGAPRVAQAE